MSVRQWLSRPLPRRLREVVAHVEVETSGLLAGLRGEQRRARAALLAALYADGVALDELRRAADERRLGPLALERALLPDVPRYTLDEVCRAVLVEQERVARWFRALERPVTPDPGARVYTENDLDIARRLEDYRRLGLTDDEMLSTARAVGRGVSQVADAIGSVVGTQLLDTPDPDPGAALGYAVEVRRIAQQDGLHLTHLLALGLAERISSHLVALGTADRGRLPGTHDVAVAFADIVGFTHLGEQLGAVELGELADRLATVTTDVLEPPVRLTKTIGDAVMFVSPDADALARSAVALDRTWHEPGGERPALRIGLAWGAAVPQAGDWFGAPVNLASRVTAAARPATVLADAELRAACTDDAGLDWTRVRARRFKGVQERHELYRVG